MNQDKYIGQLLDNRYEILDVLGVGGMAVVYKARCRRLNRMVAIKILKDEYSQDEEFRRRFHAESQAVAMLSHPNIVSVYDVSSSEDSDYIVMELIEGITLKYYMEKKGVLNWKETLHFAMQIAKALEHAHSRGIVHRDIKPHNVMVLKNGSVKVADFGIAQIMSTSNTMTQEALGSVHYISPEQAKGSRVDSRSDVYSLGIVMYEMISGRVPYDGDTPLAVVMKHINGSAQLPTTLNPNTPRALEQIIMKAISHLPKDRYATATAMLYDMDEFRKNPTMVFPEGNVAEKPAGTGVSSEPAVKPPVKDTVKSEPQRQTIAQGKAQPRKKQAASNNKTATIAIAACSAVCLVAIIILILLLPSCQKDKEQVTVPNLVGRAYNNLPSNDGIEIVLQDRQHSSQYPEGYVIDQSPAAGEKVDEGTKVFVIVSLGSDEVLLADLTGKTASEAKAYIDSLGLNLKFNHQVEDSDAVDNNCVIRTEPKAGEVVRRGQTITVYCRLDPEAVVPKVKDRLQEDAVQRLQNAGFWELEILEEKSDEPYGTVLKLTSDGKTAEIEEGKKIATDTVIYIHISKGKPVMDELKGKTKDEAVAYLESLDANLIWEEATENSVDVEEGLVVRTEPAAGTVLDENQKVTIYLSAGPGVVVVPDLLGQPIETVRESLKSMGIKNIVEKEMPSALVAGGVVKMLPAPGTEMDASTVIQVYVSKGDKGLPDLTDKTIGEAKVALEDLGLKLTVKEVGEDHESIPEGTLLRTEPAASAKLNYGQEITVYVSTGPGPIPVPSVEGEDLETARTMLIAAGFKKLDVVEENGELPKGYVLGLTDSDGTPLNPNETLVKPNETIVVRVSKGPVEVEKSHVFIIPAHDDSSVSVTILCNGVVVVENETLEAGVNTLTVTLKGSGSKEYEIRIDSMYYDTVTVEFG